MAKTQLNANVHKSDWSAPWSIEEAIGLRLPPSSAVMQTVRAAAQLAEVTAYVAESLAGSAAFGWSADSRAPSTYSELSIAYEESKATSTPLPISSLNCTTTVFSDRTFNLAARFWHDLTHIRLGADFSEAGEAAVADAQLSTLRLHGFELGSPAYRVLDIETNGQDRCLRERGCFPASQFRFTVRAFEVGIDYAIKREHDHDAIDVS